MYTKTAGRLDLAHGPWFAAHGSCMHEGVPSPTGNHERVSEALRPMR